MRYLAYGMMAVGAFEVFSNAWHLFKGSIVAIGRSAKRQHQEIPLDLADVHFFIKALFMLVFGIAFLVAGFLFVLNRDAGAWAGLVIYALFGAYGIAQAVVYRRSARVWPAALVHSVPTVLWLILR